MKIVFNLRRLLAWLAEPDRPVDIRPSRLPWWDLPSHHPCS